MSEPRKRRYDLENKGLREENTALKAQLAEIYYSFDEYKSGGLLPQGLINTLNNQQNKYKQALEEG